MTNEPLEKYEPAGYVPDAEGGRAKALDAAVRLTASTYTPPFSSVGEGGEERRAAYLCACDGFERAVVRSLVDDAEEVDG